MKQKIVAGLILAALLLWALIIEPGVSLWALNALGLHVPYTARTFFGAFLLLVILSFRFDAKSD